MYMKFADKHAIKRNEEFVGMFLRVICLSDYLMLLLLWVFSWETILPFGLNLYAKSWHRVTLIYEQQNKYQHYVLIHETLTITNYGC